MKSYVQSVIDEYEYDRVREEDMVQTELCDDRIEYSYMGSNEFKRLPVKQFTKEEKQVLELEMKQKGKL